MNCYPRANSSGNTSIQAVLLAVNGANTVRVTADTLLHDLYTGKCKYPTRF